MPDLVYRNLALEPEDDQAEVIPATLSSEYPVDRGDYVEVLRHTPESIDLSRFPLPVIESHDNSRVNVGIAESPRIEGGKLRADIRFGKSARGRELLEDVRNGVVRNLSIGYLISDFTTEGDTLTGTRWMPYEVSAVSVPADPTVGFFRGKKMVVENNEPREKLGMGTSAKRERARVQAIMEAAEKKDAVSLGLKYVEDGSSPEEFYRALIEFDDIEPISGDAGSIGLTQKEVRQFSFLKAIRAQLPGASRRDRDAAGFELEVSDAAARKYGREPQGILVPDEVLREKRDLTVGTATAGGHTVATDLDANSFIDLLRNSTVVQQAGAKVLGGLVGNLAIPRQTQGATTYWVDEGNAPTESQQAFDQVALSPKTVGAFTDFTRKLILQSSIDVENFVRGDLAAQIGVEVDRVAIEGDPDTTATQYEPRGVLNVAGIGAVALGTNGAAPTRDDLIDLVNEVAKDNALGGTSGFITNSNVISKLMKTIVDAGSGRYVMESRSRAVDFPVYESNNVPADLAKGSGSNLSAIIFANWSDLLIGYWSGVDLLVDPYTASTSGTVRVVALLDVDTAVRHAEAFAAITDAITT